MNTLTNSFSEDLCNTYTRISHFLMTQILKQHGILPTDLAHPEMPNTSFYDEYGDNAVYYATDICAYLGY